MKKKPVALIILDGWGIREMVHGNAVAQGRTPNYDNWLRSRERAVVDASGEAVGLPAGQMGNSEVGHLNLGAGRVVYQDITRIDRAIASGEFARLPALQAAFRRLLQDGGQLHLIGLLGPGGVHSHSRHLYALVEAAAAAGIDPIIHAISDGRDTPPRSGAGFAAELEQVLARIGAGIVASLSGRYYTMDRDRRWERTAQGYQVIAQHAGTVRPSLAEAFALSYAEEVTDEFIKPVVLATERDVRVQPGDCLLFFNFRADRMRQIVRAFAFPDFDGFPRSPIPGLTLLTMTEYEKDFPVQALFPDVAIGNPLAEFLSRLGLKQLHAAETEKYAHVTYFFNGGREEPFPGEERILVPSPKVATYDLQPEMSAYPLAQQVEARIRQGDVDFVLVNFANPDMVGHTGVLPAAIRAVEAVDECAGCLVQAVLDQGGAAIVTADHGNCERMVDEFTGAPHTYHTTSPVSLFVIQEEYVNLRPRGALADVAPTVLALMGLEQPAEMSGQSLLKQTGD